MTKPYDLLVIGAGPAGSAAANLAAAQGRSVVLIERDKIGGTCLNYGCDPTKALLHLANQLHAARAAAPTGLRFGTAAADWPAVQSYLHHVRNQVRGGTDAAVRRQLAEQGIDVRKGVARFAGPRELRVGDELLRAERVLIAVGSLATPPDLPGLQALGYITNREAVNLRELPRRLAIVGGGPIGVEFAQLFSRFGVQVTIVEQAPRLLMKDECALAERLRELLEAEGIGVITNATLTAARPYRQAKQLLYTRDGENGALQCDEIMIATGFRPALASLRLYEAGVATNEHGVVADATLRTSVPHIWVAGDAAGGYQFTHVAYEQGRLAAENAFAEHPRQFDEHVIPWVTYTSPELAHVGRTEDELREAGVPYRVGVKQMRDVERALLIGQPEGQVKLLVGDDGAILGGHILAAHAGELIAPLALAMRAGLRAADLAGTILPYPTLAEGVRWAAEDALG